MLSDFIAMCWLVHWYCSVYGVEYHQVICQKEVGAFLYTLDKYHGWTLCCLEMRIMNITSVLYCVVIHRYTQCYTSVILGVILLLLYHTCASIASQYVMLY